MSRILVTGAAGFIGSHLLASVRSDHEVFAMGRPSHLPAAQPGVHPVEQDLAQPLNPARLPRKVDAVVHLAQSRHYRRFPQEAADIFEINVASTARLLEWARNAGATIFVLASSGGIYGHGDKEFNENDIAGGGLPLGFYLASKHSAELLAENYSDCFTVVILRFFFVYGVGQRPDMLIPRLVRAILRKDPVFLDGKAGIRLNPVHVDDAVRAITRSLELSTSQKINVAGPEVLSIREISETIARRVGQSPVFEIRNCAATRHLVGDICKMAFLFGRPEKRFEEGIGAVCDEIRKRETD